MEDEASEAAFVRDVIEQMDFDALVSYFLMDPLLSSQIAVPEEYAERVRQFRGIYAELRAEMLQIRVRGLNPRREYASNSISNADPAAAPRTPVYQPPVTLHGSRSLAVFSAQSSLTRFMERINAPQRESPHSCALAESAAVPAAHYNQPAQVAREDFENYTIPQLKLAVQQLGGRYTKQQAAIAFLKDQKQRLKRLPDVAMTAFQLMTPQRKNDLEFRLQRAIYESQYYISIISFVPVDIAHVHAAVKSAGVQISMQFLEEYLICMGVQFCRGERKIGEVKRKIAANQLTLSENMKRRY